MRLSDLGEWEGLRDREREARGLDQLADLGERVDSRVTDSVNGWAREDTLPGLGRPHARRLELFDKSEIAVVTSGAERRLT